MRNACHFPLCYPITLFVFRFRSRPSLCTPNRKGKKSTVAFSNYILVICIVINTRSIYRILRKEQIIYNSTIPKSPFQFFIFFSSLKSWLITLSIQNYIMTPLKKIYILFYIITASNLIQGHSSPFIFLQFINY